MTTKEIKTILHESIENINDKSFLEAIRVIVEPKYKSNSRLKISDKHKSILEKSHEQIANGEYYTNDEVKKISDKWLKE
ncbi:MAG TPA: hypothetical protein PKA90_09750 [Ignavibacteria bacterium]|nr:hypothetical protein [Ignavibacteria bacterium]HMR40698.1 hypothetical protein [Ignavibacteria bacterium]